MADLERLRASVRAWMRETKDTGILPEPILRREAGAPGSEWAIFHPPEPADAARAADRYDAILEVAWGVADGRDAAWFRDSLAHPDPAVRTWAVRGVGWAAARHGALASALEPLQTDPDPAVRAAVAEWESRCAAGARSPISDP